MNLSTMRKKYGSGFCRSLDARGDGLRSRSDYPGKCRSIEIGDVSRILKRMRARGEITNRCLRVMSKWGDARHAAVL